MQEGGDEKTNTSLSKRQRATLERRKKIVEAAAECFIEQGFHQTSIRDIAKRANASLGNLYNHFESKTDLIAEIATLEADDLKSVLEILAKDSDPKEVFEAFLAAYFRYVSRPENAVLAAEITAEALRSPQIAAPFMENQSRIVESLVTVLKAYAHDFPATPREMAETILSLIESSATRVAFQPSGHKKRTLAALQSMVARLLGD